jgi:peptidyl-prolyl cis-trans isomerase C
MAQATARHILVDSEEFCTQLKDKIIEGEDFSALAQEHSRCPSGQRGGDLGSFGPGQMVQEFDTVVFSAAINDVQGPIKTQFGYHLIEVTSRSDW